MALWMRGLIGFGLLVGIYVAVAGSLVPSGHVAAARALIHRAPADLFAAISNHADQPGWRKDLQQLDVLPPRDGKTVFREKTSQGVVNFVVDESAPPKRYVVRILDENLGYGGTWTFELEPRDGGTRVTITERGEITSFLFRALSPLFSKTASIRRYLESLAAKFGENVEPEVVPAA